MLIRVLPYAGDVAHAKAKPLARRVSRAGLAVALGSVVLVAALLVACKTAQAAAVAASIVLVAFGTAWSARWLRRRLGGYTGDALGATQQISELLALLGWLAVSRWAS
ncbi:MAG: adenosylcobinamide-GDP ribazoletransferase [Pseudomonadota bacterium]